jgi:hypothetical protein
MCFRAGLTNLKITSYKVRQNFTVPLPKLALYSIWMGMPYEDLSRIVITKRGGIARGVGWADADFPADKKRFRITTTTTEFSDEQSQSCFCQYPESLTNN